MPKQSLHRTIKRWKQYEPRKDRALVPKDTRGVYVLYRQEAGNYEVVYIGVSGLGSAGGGGIHRRLRRHDKRIKETWTHFSFFEVHDNVTSEEIREIEALLLVIFRHDPRIQLTNKQKDSKKFLLLRRTSQWVEAQPSAPAGRSRQRRSRP